MTVAAAHGSSAWPPTPPGDRSDGSDRLPIERWSAFRDRVSASVPMLVERVWPEGGMGFIGAAPKSGKTWIAILFALSVATGRPFLGVFDVPRRRPVLYVAMEGTREGLRARIGALARGMGLDPDGDELDSLSFVYKPRGMNLSEPEWAELLIDRARQIDAGLVVVDVLRRAASVAEDGQGAADFAALIRNLADLEAEGRALVFCHHNKRGEVPKGGRAADRMAGSGALYGALDAGLFILSNDGARTMKVEVEARDLRAPRPFEIELTGPASGPNNGWSYADTIDVRANLEEIKSPEEMMVDRLLAIAHEHSGDHQDRRCRPAGHDPSRNRLHGRLAEGGRAAACGACARGPYRGHTHTARARRATSRRRCRADEPGAPRRGARPGDRGALVRPRQRRALPDARRLTWAAGGSTTTRPPRPCGCSRASGICTHSTCVPGGSPSPRSAGSSASGSKRRTTPSSAGSP